MITPLLRTAIGAAGLLLVIGCGGSIAADTPWDTGGTVTLLEVARYSGDPVGIVEVPFGEDQRRILARGWSPWRHPDGTLYFLNRCGERTSQAMVLEANGSSRPATPCSSTIPNPSHSATDITFVAASPTRRRVAVEGRWFLPLGRKHEFEGAIDSAMYDTIVFENDRMVARHQGFFAPAFIDEERLVMASVKGLFTVKIGGQPRPLSQHLNDAGFDIVNNPDVSPDGRRIVFERPGSLWIIDRDGSGLRQIASSEQALRFPAWSPNGRFVAYLSTMPVGIFDILAAGSPEDLNPIETVYEKYIHYVDPGTGEQWVGDITAHLGQMNMPKGQLSWLPKR